MAIPAVDTSLPSANSQSSAAKISFGNDLVSFVKLLTAQLKNQDPTDPLDTNQITSQIAMLSQVEQQINTNKNLEDLLKVYTASQYNNTVSYIGKKIEAPGDGGSLNNGKGLFTYYLADNADHAKITIKDEAGTVVFEGSAGTLKGRNEYVWDGKNMVGQSMPNGTYTFEIEAEDSNKVPIASQTFTSGVVTSVDSVNGKIYLSVNDLSVLIENVQSIHEA